MPLLRKPRIKNFEIVILTCSLSCAKWISAFVSIVHRRNPLMIATLWTFPPDTFAWNYGDFIGSQFPFFVGCHSLASFGSLNRRLFVLLTRRFEQNGHPFWSPPVLWLTATCHSCAESLAHYHHATTLVCEILPLDHLEWGVHFLLNAIPWQHLDIMFADYWLYQLSYFDGKDNQYDCCL